MAVSSPNPRWNSAADLARFHTRNQQTLILQIKNTKTVIKEYRNIETIYLKSIFLYQSVQENQIRNRTNQKRTKNRWKCIQEFAHIHTQPKEISFPFDTDPLLAYRSQWFITHKASHSELKSVRNVWKTIKID
jgi:hypothetical protein